MRERPILFSAPMVRAILEGRKTQTRRVVKPQPIHDTSYCGGAFIPVPKRMLAKGAIASKTSVKAPYVHVCGPYGAPGDRLWVKETHALEHCVDGNEPPYSDGRPVRRAPEDDCDGVHPLWTQAHYRATDPAPDLCCERDNCAQCRDHDMGPHWRPSIHMPRWASRITLEVTGVRVERLQDISQKDALAEGAPPSHPSIDYISREYGFADFPRSWFGQLWESINGAGSWDANPWVWVIEFRRIEQEAKAS